jgi:CheY-like chemotaxis protein
MSNGAIDILLVEDNDNDAELAMRALRQHQLANNIRHVRDGAEALSILFEDHQQQSAAAVKPRLVLLDLKMPKIDGIEVLQKLKADERTQHIPVVVLTSSQEEQDVVQSYRLGVNSYIIKPVDFQQFTDATKTLGMYWMLLNHAPN